MVLELKPIKETVKFIGYSSDMLKVNCPCSLAVVPLEEPSTKIFAPKRGSLLESTTDPVIIVCAKRLVEKYQSDDKTDILNVVFIGKVGFGFSNKLQKLM